MLLSASRTHRRTASATLAAAALGGVTLLAACGPAPATTFSGAKGDVQQVVKRLSASANKDDAGKICRDLITPKLSKELASQAGGSCPKAVGNAINHTDYLDLTVKRITLDGDAKTATSAVVQVSVPDTNRKQRTTQLALTRADAKSDWLISDFNAPAASPKGTTPKATTPKGTTPEK